MKHYKDIDLDAHFSLANQGKLQWEMLEEKFHGDLYILFPHIDEEYNYYALLYLDEYIVAKKAKNVVLIASETVIKDVLPVFSQSNVQFFQTSIENIKAIIKYYALYEFSSRLTIISLKEPYDTCGENLLGVKGVTKEDLLCMDIYHFSLTPHKKPPVYYGNDNDILRFIRLGG